MSNSDYKSAINLVKDAIKVEDRKAKIKHKKHDFGDGEFLINSEIRKDDMIEIIKNAENYENGWKFGDSYSVEGQMNESVEEDEEIEEEQVHPDDKIGNMMLKKTGTPSYFKSNKKKQTVSQKKVSESMIGNDKFPSFQNMKSISRKLNRVYSHMSFIFNTEKGIEVYPKHYNDKEPPLAYISKNNGDWAIEDSEQNIIETHKNELELMKAIDRYLNIRENVNEMNTHPEDKVAQMMLKRLKLPQYFKAVRKDGKQETHQLDVQEVTRKYWGGKNEYAETQTDKYGDTKGNIKGSSRAIPVAK